MNWLTRLGISAISLAIITGIIDWLEIEEPLVILWLGVVWGSIIGMMREVESKKKKPEGVE
jgi:hypothetical protein